MKLRMTHNSIRIRIRKSELETLHQKGTIEESIQFPTGIVFKFALRISDDNEVIIANLEANIIKLSISKLVAHQWLSTNQVGIETQLDLPNNEQLHLLIEKDFPCVDRPEEDKSDTFWELASDKPDVC